MSERTSYAAGTPCWVDHASPNLDASIEFYGALFGWDVPETENSQQFGGYRQAMKDGKPVGGMMPAMEEGQPTVWTSYVSVENADATAAKVTDAGGSVIAEPMDVGELGRMAVFVDPTGAVFGIWQPNAFIGAQLVNEPGALSWNELGTRDPAAAKAFYTEVFGWGTRDSEMPGGGGTYTEWLLGEASIGGMSDITGRVPDEVPSHWLTYFAVEDTDATLETVKEKGGGVAFGPIDIPAGRFAIVQDPHGAAFAVIALPEVAAGR